MNRADSLQRTVMTLLNPAPIEKIRTLLCLYPLPHRRRWRINIMFQFLSKRRFDTFFVAECSQKLHIFSKFAVINTFSYTLFNFQIFWCHPFCGQFPGLVLTVFCCINIGRSFGRIFKFRFCHNYTFQEDGEVLITSRPHTATRRHAAHFPCFIILSIKREFIKY